jgi:hypothetical protein
MRLVAQVLKDEERFGPPGDGDRFGAVGEVDLLEALGQTDGGDVHAGIGDRLRRHGQLPPPAIHDDQ